MVNAEFDDGRGGTVIKPIAGSYVEFAERKIKPGLENKSNITRGDRREGFEANNANKIFESTYRTQTIRTAARQLSHDEGSMIFPGRAGLKYDGLPRGARQKSKKNESSVSLVTRIVRFEVALNGCRGEAVNF